MRNICSDSGKRGNNTASMFWKERGNIEVHESVLTALACTLVIQMCPTLHAVMFIFYALVLLSMPSLLRLYYPMDSIWGSMII